ncbi:MAG TPA: TadE/TadG family type IV pilus assembly protein [Zeimonas sp.]|nr:TadE/TadG family type IV pilus assembly protein [Zeimonas sp.]
MKVLPSRSVGCPARRQRASALVETLLAAPIVLLLGLGALQWALLLHARTALEYGLFEAARAGSVAHARPDAIEAGLARGLLPFWQSAGMPRGQAAALAAAQARLAQGLAAGWIDWLQLAPTLESFADWAEPALDDDGRPMPGVPEIPNDSLQYPWLRAPAGDVATMRGREPIGARSQQTLNDANVLKLELRYGVPLAVPLVGRIASWMARIVDGCDAPSRRRAGLVDLGEPAAAASRAWACAIHRAPDREGRIVPRWPVRVSATVRMQSPARRSAKTRHRSQSPVRIASASPFAGSPPPPSSGASLPTPVSPPLPASRPFPPAPPEPSTPPSLVPEHGSPPSPASSAAPAPPRARVDPDTDGSRRRSPGWLQFGGERSFSVPGACGA